MEQEFTPAKGVYFPTSWPPTVQRTNSDIYFIDFEIWSEVDVRVVGAHAYARHPSTKILFLSWAKNDEPVQIWAPGRVIPAWMKTQDRTIVAHNAEFEWAIWNEKMPPEVAKINIATLEDTAAAAVYIGLPRDLDELGKCLNLKNKKQTDGKTLIALFCGPKDVKPREHWEEWKRFVSYGMKDVETMREAYKYHLPRLAGMERLIFLAHLQMNARGVGADIRRIIRLNDICNHAERLLKATTYGKLLTSPVAIKRKISEVWVDIPNAQKETLEALLEDPELPDDIRELVTFRLQLAKASVKKLRRAILADTGERLRGMFFYFGGHTGRWSGKVVQLQNLIRDCVKEIDEALVLIDSLPDDLDDCVALLGGPGEAIKFGSTMVRPMLKAKDGHEFVALDYKAVEARQLCWLTGAQHILERYKREEDLYAVMGQYMYKMKYLPDKKSKERKAGKDTFLGCGYGMGKFALQRYCAKNGSLLTLDECGLGVNGYREMIPEVPQGWRICDEAISQVMSPESGHAGRSLFGGKLVLWTGRPPGSQYTDRPDYLACRLPSGRIFRWYQPRYSVIPSKDGSDQLVFSYATYRGDPKRSLPALLRARLRELKEREIHPSRGNYDVPGTPVGWHRYTMWGGHFIENIIQALCRDLLAWSMVEFARRKIPVVMTIHDELVLEVPKDKYTYAEMAAVMETPPKWAEGSVIGVEGWIGPRYKKD